MWMGLLGPLQVIQADAEIAVPGPRLRALLAALLMRANDVTSVDRLVELVWDENAPPGAGVTVRSYVKRLRQVLGAEAGARIMTRYRGYTIHVDTGELDVLRFGALCRDGRAAVRAGEWERGHAVLDEAVSLWRGAPLADIPSPSLRRDEVPRLEEAWLQALEWRSDAALQLQRHDELIPELRTVTELYPLRERLGAQLMLALARSGRQAEALAAYQRARRLLADEIGVEPGSGLQEVHKRILRADLAATGPMTVSLGPALPPPQAQPGAPRHLPAPPTGFTGRKPVLDALGGRLAESATAGTVAISVVSGTAGVGKTALALHWAHSVAAQFPDGQLFVNLRGFGPLGSPAVPPVEVLADFLASLGMPPERIPVELDARAAAYRSLLAGRRILVLLDNARDEAHVRPLLPGHPGCMVLVTSRRRLTGLVAAEGATAITLDVLSQDEAGKLLARRLGRQRASAEPAAVADLTRLCARLPLALAIAAAQASSRPRLPLATLAEELGDTRGRLDALEAGDPATSVRTAFSWSCQLLSGPAAQMFRLLSIHPGPDISVLTAASLAAAPVPSAREAFRELVDWNLLTEQAPGRFAWHDLLRAYAAEQCCTSVSEQERDAAARRLLDHYLHTADAADLLINPDRDPVPSCPPPPSKMTGIPADAREAIAWFQAEHVSAVLVVEFAAEHGYPEHAWRIAWALATFLERQGHWHDWVASQRTALAAARGCGNELAEAYALFGIGRACSALGRCAEALTSLDHARDVFGRLESFTGQVHAEQSTARALSDYRASHAHCQQALALFQQVGHKGGEAQTWDSLGYTYHRLGEYRRSIGCYHRAAGLFAELGDHYKQAETFDHLGDAYLAVGELCNSQRALQQAVDILDRLEHPDARRIRAKLASVASR
jgi:DNA-binding SARP family transcriptional activator